MISHSLKQHKIILASGSPRRQDFLSELKIPFEIRLKEVEETYPSNLVKEEITNYLSELKASVFSDLADHEILVTGDTIVWHNNQALGKPKNKLEAFEMIESLSGKTHQVISSFCLKTNRKIIVKSDLVDVHFRKLSAEEINFYIDHFKPFDKAGAYGIQEWIGKIGIDKISGSFYTVMGMPVHLFYEELQKLLKKKY
ncbi:MAG: Maf family nucleotide pyrophosphatase [Bacteroidota bacterium]